MSELEELRSVTSEGIFVDNLYRMAKISKELMRCPNMLVPGFVLRSAFLNVADAWDERPIVVEDVNELCEQMRETVLGITLALENGVSSEQLTVLLERLISVSNEAAGV